jgi:selenocysteine lyase/cysteine desulfurase
VRAIVTTLRASPTQPGGMSRRSHRSGRRAHIRSRSGGTSPAGVAELPQVTVFGGADGRLPVFAFTVAQRSPALGEYLAGRGVSVWTGPSGVTQLMAAFGADELGGAAFAGFMPHTTFTEVDRLIAALAHLA